MTLRILIVDDEPLALDRIRFALQGIEDVEVVGEAHTGAQALDRFAALKPDILLLDIQMPGGTGIDVARKLAAERGGPELVFVTAFDSFAADAFDLDASDYLLKPVRADRLLAAIDRAKRRMGARAAGERIAELELIVQRLANTTTAISAAFASEIWVPRPGGLSRLPVENIIWIEAARDYLLVHTAHRSFIMRETMSAMGRRLDPDRMIRVHRSAFVNKSKIEEVSRCGRDGFNLTLENGAVIRVGASFRQAVLAAVGSEIPNRAAVAGGKD